jgi:hypothetical protein
LRPQDFKGFKSYKAKSWWPHHVLLVQGTDGDCWCTHCLETEYKIHTGKGRQMRGGEAQLLKTNNFVPGLW